MKNLNRDVGKNFELLAEKFLTDKKYIIIERNFYSSHWEIDLIALDGDILVFIEIKGRVTAKFGSPAESVTKNKQKNIIKCAKYYIHKNNLYDKFVRFDVIEVYSNSINNEVIFNHIENAFYCE